MSFGVDFSESHPTISQMKAAGVQFVCRYISQEASNDANGKNLVPSEATALRDAGIEIVVVVEETANRMLGGHASGVSDAQHADAVVKGLGMPGMPVYFACDFDATPGDQVAIDSYLDGCASVVGVSRVGIYGGYWPCMRAWKSGKVKYVWQTYAWSGTNLPGDSHDLGGVTRHLFQYSNDRVLGGASVDFDKSLASDFGQWPRPKGTPAPQPNPNPPSEVAGAYRWEADGKQSLDDVAKGRDTSVWHVVKTSWAAGHLNDDNKLALALYLAFPGRAEKMPKGLVYYTSNK